MDLLDTYLDLLDNKYTQETFCLSPRRLEGVFKTCLQDIFRTCLQDVFRTCLQDAFKTFWRCLTKSLQEVLNTSRKKKNCYARDVFKMSDLDSLLEKIHSCQNDPKKSYTEKKAKHMSSTYSWTTFCSFDASKNKRGYYREKYCMKMFCKDLRGQAMKITNYEKNK